MCGRLIKQQIINILKIFARPCIPYITYIDTKLYITNTIYIIPYSHRLIAPIDRSLAQSKRTVGTEKGSVWPHSRRGGSRH